MMTHPLHVLITGGSRGIGLATAQLFARKGYRCTLLSRSSDALKTAVASLPQLSIPEHPEDREAPLYYTHAYIPGCITSGPAFWSTDTSIRSDSPTKLGGYLPKPPKSHLSHPSIVDVLVNCAGISQASLFTTTSDASIEAILNTNLTGLMLSTRFLLRHGYLRRERKTPPMGTDMLHSLGGDTGGVIINVASLLGLKGGYGAVAYAAAKAGVLGFTRALATEYASTGVRVNAVVPGYMETGMTKSLNRQELEKQIPLGRFGHPDEIAHAVLFLAENGYAHNCVVNLDGGLSAV